MYKKHNEKYKTKLQKKILMKHKWDRFWKTWGQVYKDIIICGISKSMAGKDNRDR